MTDTQRTLAAILALIPDNATGLISPQDFRDVIESLHNGHGEISVTTPAATTVVTQNVWYDVAGTWALTTGSMHWDMNTNGQLRYTGAAKRSVHIAASFSVTGEGNNDVYEFGVAKGGTILTPSIVARKIGTGADVGSTAVHAFCTVENGDYLTLQVRNTTDADNPTMTYANLFAMDMVSD